MKQLLLLLPFLALLTGFASCNNQRTPEAAIEKAYGALQTSDLNSFREALRDDALDWNGSPEGMAELQKGLNRTQVTYGNASLIDSVRRENGHVDFIFEIEILTRQPDTILGMPAFSGLPMHYKTATVICDAYPQKHGHPDMKTSYVVCKISELE